MHLALRPAAWEQTPATVPQAPVAENHCRSFEQEYLPHKIEARLSFGLAITQTYHPFSMTRDLQCLSSSFSI
jgi:hypothetical protein